ncbi:peptidylprolyl isomerase [Paucibacter sp. R3-3]|uniref:peptidylprolyl isomerase n=1 Tax=Roseateles agri TaxID=3098619 RepID=A0ABU5DEX4_9BURK|nr:peptidylprolyl isomerase [Paucibacter sp. R3-3]MDY0744699.1 peptidylprolyl isomerase [Paucibacter sp. R3-3]
MNPKHSFLSRRTLGIAAIGAAATLLLASCGGGTSGPDNSTPSDYNTKTPGTVTLTVTHRVAIAVSMPDLSGVTNPSTLDQAGLKALPTVTKTINIGLDHKHAPISTDNFLAYLNSGAYTNTVFHRVIAGFVAQGGGYTAASDGTLTAITTNAAITLESQNGLANTRGTLAMARTTDPNSATSQFYFNLVNNVGPAPFLVNLDYQSADSPGYAVFGTVMDQASLDVMDAIAKIGTDSSDRPLVDITITSITVK